MASFGLWTLPFCSLAGISPTFCSVASLPIESTPLFFLGWHLDGVGPLSPPAAATTTVRRQGPVVGRRARGTWTTTLDFVQKALHLGATLPATQDGLDEYARDKRPGLLVPHSAGCHATPQRSRPKTRQPDLLAPRYAIRLNTCQPHAPHLPAQLREQPAQGLVPPLSLFLALPARPEFWPRGRHTGIKTLDNQ